MSSFSLEWLALREPFDVRARSGRLALAAGVRLAEHSTVRILDLATGTGSNLRYLFDYLPPDQEWLAVDRDAQLLGAFQDSMAAWAGRLGFEFAPDERGVVVRGRRRASRITTEVVDLATATVPALFAGRQLVTASALLDLVSERWLRTLVSRCRQSGASALFALTYDGRMTCSPPEPDDELIRLLVNRHQRTDKGFGPALGPRGAEVAEKLFADAGFDVRREPSDWTLPPDAAAVQRALVDGWVAAGIDLAPGELPRIQSWRSRRLAHIAAGSSRIVVGHADLSAHWP